MWFIGRVPIDTVWLSEDTYVYDHGLLLFGFGFFGHLRTFLGVANYDIIGEFPLKIPRPEDIW